MSITERQYEDEAATEIANAILKTIGDLYERLRRKYEFNSIAMNHVIGDAIKKANQTYEELYRRIP